MNKVHHWLLVALFLMLTSVCYATQGPGLPTHSVDSTYKFLSGFGAPSGKGHGNIAMVNGYLMTIWSSDGGGDSDDGGIDFWDISNADSPQRVYRYDNSDTHGLREPHGFGFSSSYTLNGNQVDLMVAQGVKGIQIWDLTDPSDIDLLSYVDLPGISKGDYSGAWWVFWQAPYVYVAARGTGLVIVDATDPEDPRYVTTISPAQLGGVKPGGVFAVGNILLVGDINNGTATHASLDISNPDVPRLLHVKKGATAGYSHIFAAGKILVSGKGSNDSSRSNTMFVYDVDHDGTISFNLRGTRDGRMRKGGYGSYQDGKFFSGFSRSFTGHDVENGNILGLKEWKKAEADVDFATVLGHMVWVGDDHGIASHLAAHDTQPDTTPPTVEWMHPADGSINLSARTRVGLAMSDNIDVESLTSATFSVRPVYSSGLGPAVQGHYSGQMSVVNFSPHEPLLPNTTYEITVDGVEDWAGNQSPRYTATITTGGRNFGVDVPNVALVQSDKDIEVRNIKSGGLVYLDRTYTFADLPAYLEGHQGIVTANDNKGNDQTKYIRFNLSHESYIYILYDDRADVDETPWWLRSYYQWNGEKVEIVGDSADRKIYRRVAPPGQIVLGGPSADGESNVKSNYTVVIVRVPEETIPVTLRETGNEVQVARIEIGQRAYIDRSYEFMTLPDYLDGAIGLLTHNDQKGNKEDDFIQFELEEESDVYILFDGGVTTQQTPNWLKDNFQKKLHSVTLEGAGDPRAIYFQTMAPGVVQLGGPRASGSSNRIDANYIVAIVPTSVPENVVETLPSPYSGEGYSSEIGRIRKGNAVYLNDDDFQFGEVPTYLDGQQAILTHTNGNFLVGYSLRFNANSDSVLYVLYDDTDTLIPSWLEGFEVMPGFIEIHSEISPSSKRRIYRKIVYAGEVELGEPETRRNYTVVVVPLAEDIPVAGVTSSKDHRLTTIVRGAKVYTDRNHTFSSLPSYLDGQVGIITANDDKKNDESVYLEFEVTVNSSIFVLFDERATDVPDWLEDHFAFNGDTIFVDGSTHGRHVYEGTFQPGTVQLGGARADLSGTDKANVRSNYAVIIGSEANSGLAICAFDSNSVPVVEVDAPVSLAASRVEGSGVIEYSWDFGDGSAATPYQLVGPTVEATHQYTSPGRYSPLLTVRNDLGRTICSTMVVVHEPKTALAPARSSSIVGNALAVFNVNSDNDTVSAISKGQSAQKLWEASVGSTPTSLTLTGNDLWVANSKSDDIYVLDARDGSFIQKIDLPRGSKPYGIVAAPNGQNVYLTVQGAGGLYKYDAVGRTELWRTDVLSVDQSGGLHALLVDAKGIAISGDSTKAYITRFRSDGEQATIFVVDLGSTAPTTAGKIYLAKDPGPDGEDSARGVPSYLNSLTISPDGGGIKIASVKANIDRGMFRDGQELDFESRIRTIVSHVDTGTSTEILTKRVDVDDRDSGTALVYSEYGSYYVVVFQGNDTLQVRDSQTNDLMGEASTEAAPRDLVLVNDYLYVHNFLGRSVSVYDMSGIATGTMENPVEVTKVGVVATEAMQGNVLAGKRIFYNAEDQRMSRDGYTRLRQYLRRYGGSNLTKSIT